MSPEEQARLRDALWPPSQPTPRRELRCRHCGRSNRVPVPIAALTPERCRCGSCKSPLFLRADEPLADLASRSYEHGLDSKSLAALQSIPGFGLLGRWTLKQLADRATRILFQSSNLRCGPEQFPELSELLDTAVERLGLGFLPQLFLGASPVLNAGATGVHDRYIVLRTAMADQCDDAELLFVLGHELGHLHADHTLARVLAVVLAAGGILAAGGSRLLVWPLQRALTKWNRCGELTADRAGLLCCRDLPAALSLLAKLSGGARMGSRARTRLRLDSFVRQARELADGEDASLLDSSVATLLTMDRSHPFTAWRAMHLIDWVTRGSYLDILAGQYDREPAATVEEETGESEEG